MWQPIETFPYPEKEWDYEYPSYLFYIPNGGIVIGRCILQDEDEKSFRFEYGRDGWEFSPTHWQPLPDVPPDE